MKHFIMFIFAAALAYGNEWIPYYVAMYSKGNLTIQGSLKKWETACDEVGNGVMGCTNKYVIPQNYLRNKESQLQSVGLGIIISATEISCSNSNSLLEHYGDRASASSVLDVFKTYQTVSLPRMRCEGDLIIKSWNPSSYNRRGHIGSPVVIGDSLHINLIKKAIEFFTTYLYFIIAVILAAIFLLKRAVFSKLVRVSDKRSSFEEYIIPLFFFCVIKGGLFELALPLVSGQYLFPRISNFFDLIAHVGPGFAIIALQPKLNGFLAFPVRTLLRHVAFSRRFSVTYLQIFVMLLCLSPWFGHALGFVGAAAAILCLVFGLSRKSSLLSFYGLALCVDVSKLVNFVYSPYGNISLIFGSLILVSEFFTYTQQSASFVGTVQWAKDQAGKSVGDASTLLCEFADRFTIRQISYIQPLEGGSCTIISLKKMSSSWQLEEKFIEIIPPMYAHVLSTRESIWHIDQHSEFASNLKYGKKSLKLYQSTYFTVIPLLRNSIPVGALAFTNYPDIFVLQENKKLELELATQLITPFLASLTSAKMLVANDDWSRSCAVACNDLLNLTIVKLNGELESELDNAAQVISERLSVATIIGRLDSATRRVSFVGIAGFSKEVTEAYLNAHFYAHSENEQGPMPLAINLQRPVSIPDVSWLRGVLHPLSISLMEKSETRSCVAVPIFLSEEGKKSKSDRHLWGVIWLESNKLGTFIEGNESSLVSVAATLANVITKYARESVFEKAFSSLIRKDIANRLLAGEKVREEAFGIILKADVRGSTSLAAKIGTVNWNKFTNRINEDLLQIGKSFGYQLQSVVWDAFHFTKESQVSQFEMNNLVLFSRRINAYLEQVMRAEFGDLIPVNDNIRARFCFEYGDITRDIQNGSWTVVGDAMVNVCKLEDFCKRLSGTLFTTEATLKEGIYPFFEKTDAVVPATGRKVIGYTLALDALQDDLLYIEDCLNKKIA